MTLTLDIDREAEERLRRRAERIGVPLDRAEREVIKAAQNPPDSQWAVLGFILLLALLAKGKEFSSELDQAISMAFQPMVDHLIKHGTEEQLAALLPKMPPIDAKQQAALALLDQWDQEDAAMTEEEKDQADQDLEEFKRNINANRAATGEEPIYG